MHAIETTGLVKRYQHLTAVDQLTLQIRRGELFSLLGVNGAGKTTLIKLLSCLTKPTDGDALVGGMNVIYQVERLPLMLAILIHGCVLYGTYLATYLLNGWLELGAAPVLVFSAIFLVGYLVIWAIIYTIIKKNIRQLNSMLSQKQQGNNP